MDQRFMQTIVQDAWQKVPPEIQTALRENRTIARTGLRVEIKTEDQNVSFRVEGDKIVGYIMFEADIVVDGVERNPKPKQKHGAQ